MQSEPSKRCRFRFGGLPELYVYREPVEEEEEPSSPPVEAEVWQACMLVELYLQVD